MTIYRGPGGTGSATSDADTNLYQQFLDEARDARDAALAAQTAAELAETNAETAETNAETAATNAANSASSASSSASAAATSASNASSSASTASSSASSASTSATNAANSATAAAASATSAANSASTATTQASNASSSATAAASSASNAATSATNAANSASSASTSATNAANSATGASNSASSAATSATNAANSATSASNSASAAAASASEAAGYAASINPADLVHISGTETITGAKTFSQTITGSITGNAGTVTNGVYTTGDQTIAGTKTFSSNPIVSSGTTNGVAYLNGSKVLATGSALTFDGTNLGIGTSSPSTRLSVSAGATAAAGAIYINQSSTIGAGSGAVVFAQDGAEQGRVYPLGGSILAFSTGGTQTERARIDSSGNFGIGTAAPLNTTANRVYLSLKGTGTTGSDGSGVLQFQTNAAGSTAPNIGNIEWCLPDNTGSSTTRVAYIASIADGVTENNRGAYLAFATKPNGVSGAGTERMRIDSSGNLLVGTTSTLLSSKFASVASASQNGGVFQTTAAAGNYTAIAGARNGNNGNVAEWWYNTSTQVGTISITGSSTSYNTSSDYRLKENIKPMTGALAKVAALKPCTYKWKADGSDGEGFIAHELAEVCPDAVTGEKDAVDAAGNPVYQGIDTSFLVATLTAAIQELKAEFDAYKAAHP